MKPHSLVRPLVSILAIVCCSAALATPPQSTDGSAVQLDRITVSPAGHRSPSLAMDCARPTRPSQGEFARATGIANQGQAFAARTTLMVNLKRDCRGADRIRIIFDGEPQVEQGLATR